uniref:Uncharacterized protein n=1 Tax=Gadus morhua TaxID=8049 RepID=A0A8C5AMW2_GADMO
TTRTSTAAMEKKVGKCLLDNWVEERAVADLADDASQEQIQRDGHRGIFSMNLESKMEDITSLKSAYTPPVAPGVRERGTLVICVVYHVIYNKFNPVTPTTDFSSTTHRDFTGGGFVPLPPTTTKNYIETLFWLFCFQRTTAVRTTDSPFKRCAQFSTPITQQLNDQ